MTLGFVVPGRLDQLTGGYLYDRHVVDGLRARGMAVDVVELPGAYPDADAATRRAAAEALARQPDGRTVVIDGLALPGLVDSLSAHANRLRLVGFIHHPLSLETGLSPSQVNHYAALEADLWPQLKGVICPSEHTARAVRDSGLPAGRVAVVAPGVYKPAGLRKPELLDDRPLQLLSVGTITPRKGHVLLVDALAALRGLPWQLTCIGSLERDPAAAAQLRDRIADHGLQGRITLLGEQPPGRLAQAYQQAQVFVLPSYHEGYGMVFAEALAHGLPVVSTTAGAIVDTVPAAASLLVPPGEAAALREALRQVITDASLRTRLTQAAQTVAGTLPDWSETVARWAAALDQVSR